MHRLLFELQGELGEATYFEAAEHLELDLERFAEDSRPERWEDLIERDLAQGKKLGVRGTPTVFVNGVMMIGVDYAQLKEMVDKALE
jgi:protein-disulfide isomerase